MLIFQLTAGDGPAECCLAVSHALSAFLNEAEGLSCSAELIESVEGPVRGTLRSVLIGVDGANTRQLKARWSGTIKWVCQSPYRPQHARKNWFIGCDVFENIKPMAQSDIRFQACRSSGAGGQHVNKTNSAIWATHIETGLQVKVQTERSQHANKRLAGVLLAHKVQQLEHQQTQHQQQERWYAHKTLERGNPVLVFKGVHFYIEN
jgi:peptide chain release factor